MDSIGETTRNNDLKLGVILGGCAFPEAAIIVSAGHLSYRSAQLGLSLLRHLLD